MALREARNFYESWFDVYDPSGHYVRTGGPPLYALEDDAIANVRYVGSAALGSSTSDAVWQIARYYKNGDITTVEYANSGAYTAIWNSRTTYFTSPTTLTGVYGAKTITGTPALGAVSTSNRDGRTFLSVVPTTGTVYWGFDSSVSTSNGFPLLQNQIGSWNARDTDTIYLVSGGSIDVRIVER